MGEWSFPFQSSNRDRAYSDADFAQYYANFFTTGIIATIGTGLQVKQTTQPSMNIVLGMGAANIKGRHYLNTSEKNFVIPVPSTTQERTDSIVIRLSLTDRTILSVYKENSTQVVQTDDIFELQLCTIKVPANATSISQANITDKRSDKNVCGFSTPFAELNVGDLMAQYEAQVQEWFDQAQVNVNNLIQNYDQQFQDWFKNLKDQLDDNQAANLQNQIDAINGVIVQKNIPDGANLDEYKAEGEFSKKTPTVVTGAPEGVTGAFRLSVRTMLGSSGIFQTLYDYATRSMYYRIGNTTLGFNLPWKKVATTDDIKELTTGDTNGFKPLTMAEGFTANQAEYCIKNGWIFITVQGARPNSTITGQSYYTFLTLPAEITAHITHTEGFMWSNFQGGGTTYSGGVLTNGQVQLYLAPKTNSIVTNHRFSFNMTIPLRTT